MSQLKLLLVGESGVGKTSLMIKYVDGILPKKIDPTIGVDCMVKKIDYGGIDINLQIWETAGNEKYRALSRTYYRGANGVFVVYDLNNLASYEKANSLIQDVRLSTDAPIFLIGNKSEINRDYKVKFNFPEDVRKFEVSAFSGDGISQAVLEMIRLVYKEKQTIVLTESKIYSEENQKYSCCWQ